MERTLARYVAAGEFSVFFLFREENSLLICLDLLGSIFAFFPSPWHFPLLVGLPDLLVTSVGSELYSGTGLTALVTLCFVFNPLFPCPREYVYPIHTERALTPFLNTMTCQAIFSQTLLPFDHTLSLSLTVFFCFVFIFLFLSFALFTSVYTVYIEVLFVWKPQRSGQVLATTNVEREKNKRKTWNVVYRLERPNGFCVARLIT